MLETKLTGRSRIRSITFTKKRWLRQPKVELYNIVEVEKRTYGVEEHFSPDPTDPIEKRKIDRTYWVAAQIQDIQELGIFLAND